MKRQASAVWQGSLNDGKGIFSTEIGVLAQAQYSFATTNGKKRNFMPHTKLLKILITGATEQVGSKLIKFLSSDKD